MAASAPFGDLLRRYRLAAGLTQEVLAETAGLSVPGISDLERGVRRVPRRDTIQRLADALRLPATERAALEDAARAARAQFGAPRIAAPPGAAGHAARIGMAAPDASPAAPQHNLPAPLTSLIGRAWEQEEVKQLLGTTRLLTLTGAGGCGKTRLALAVAGDLVETHQDGVWLVDLAALGAPQLVPRAVAAALGVREEPRRPLLATLAASLAQRGLLLVLDNCEHLISACADLATALLSTCPLLQILATSREVLGVAGETTWRVPSLSLPDAAHRPATARLVEYEAVRLFLERARAVRPGFALSDRNAAPVLEVCRRLDGIPLAIELAAARLAVLSIEQVATRLDDRFRLLTGGSRTALPRQQTLRATLDWSYALLAEPERILLRRLSVFAGSWMLAAAEAVCGEGTLDLLARLVSKSLVLMEEQDGEARYRMLETVRQYGCERLEATGEADLVHQRHCAWCLALAEAAEQHERSAQENLWLDRLNHEHDNLRAALAWSLAHAAHQPAFTGGPSGELGPRLAAALWRFWWLHGHLSEGRHWLEMALALRGEALPAVRARTLIGAGVLALVQGDYATAVALVEEALMLFRELGDTREIAHALTNLGYVAYMRSEYARAVALYEESLALHRELEDRRGTAAVLSNLGIVADDLGDYGQAMVYHEESVALWRQEGDGGAIAIALVNLGTLALKQGATARASALFGESRALWSNAGSPWEIAWALWGLGEVARHSGDCEQATALYHQSLDLFRSAGEKYGMAGCLSGLGAAAYRLGDPEQAGIHAGAGLTLFQELQHKPGIARTWQILGRVAYRQGDAARAGTLLTDALRLCRTISARPDAIACLEGLAELAGAREHTPRATRLFAAATALREATGLPRSPVEREAYERHLDGLHAILDEEAFASAWTAGRRMPLDEAITYALAPHGDGEAYPAMDHGEGGG